MRVVSLFSGIGGFERGFAKADAGFRTLLACECWAPAVAVLRERFPDVPVHDDVRTLRSLPEDADVLVGGFPCQDLSQAGKTAGIDGARSSLVGEVFRLVDASSVPWVVLENVSFMLHLDGGRAMDRLVSAFEERGYRWAYRVVNTLAWLPQRRERVYFLASRVADPADVLFDDDVAPRLAETDLDRRAHGFYWTEGIRGLGWAPDAVPTLKNGSTVGIPSPPAILLPDGRIIQPDIRDAERLQGFDEDWTAPAAEVARSSLRWSLVGNAVSVPVTRWLATRLGDPPGFDRGRESSLFLVGRWPRAARYDGHRRVGVEVGAYPVWKERLPLAEFLRHPGRLLSERATRGFLARAEISSLTLITPEFKKRVRAHLDRVSETVLPVAAE